MITQERLKELVRYNPDTGIFTWKVSTSSRAKVGAVAGHPNKRDGYIDMHVDGYAERAHRFVFIYMTGSLPKGRSDHISGVRDDNRWVNLRDATASENNKNARISKNNTSGFNGVVWNKKINKWQSQIRVNYKSINLGYYVDFNKAVAARRQANIEYGFHENHGRKV